MACPKAGFKASSDKLVDMSSASFFFYDLETSSISPFDGRIMQYAGRRTTLELEPIGEPVNILIKMTDDILPEPDAIFVTGITPQATIADGITEAEFLRIFHSEIALSGTIFAGYNTVRFDDEFMRLLHYRNFYDPYEWQWKDARSRWDLLDVVRMTRALRPEGITWPFDPKGNPSNRLELLTAVNQLSHENAHDALSDVDATISLARLIRQTQGKLFDYLLSMRDKRKIADLVEANEPFVYASGKYPAEFEKTTVAHLLGNHPKKQGVFVYDLRHDPTQYKDLSSEQLADLWRWKRDAEAPRLPVKVLQYNRCPAVAPLSVLDVKSQERLKIDLKLIKKHRELLKTMPDFINKLYAASEILEGERPKQAKLVSSDIDVDTRIYEGFFGDSDKNAMRVVRAADGTNIGSLDLDFDDHRLEELLPLYKARNYPKNLTDEDRIKWEDYRNRKLLGGGQQSKMAKFYARLQELATRSGITSEQEYLLEELQLYAQSIMPDPSL